MHTILESGTKRVTIGPDRPFCVIGRCGGEPPGPDAAPVEAAARAQLDGGAHLLAVAAGPAPLDGERLDTAVRRVQACTDRPLCLDATSGTALGPALAACRGKALVRSVAAGGGRLDTVLALVRRYGAALVAVPAGSAGAPDTARERLEYTHRIVDLAAGAYDIPIEDILIDPLPPAGPAAPDADVTLETIALVGDEYGLNMVLGLEAPAAGYLDAGFLAAAVAGGLTGAVLDTRATHTMDWVRAADRERGDRRPRRAAPV